MATTKSNQPDDQNVVGPKDGPKTGAGGPDDQAAQTMREQLEAAEKEAEESRQKAVKDFESSQSTEKTQAPKSEK